jgi:hypothetical protein
MMMKKTPASLSLIVSGDLTMDWNLARTRRFKGIPLFWSEDTTRIFWQRGGSALLADLIQACACELADDLPEACSIYQPSSPQSPSEVSPDDPRFHHSFALWSLYKYGEKPPLDKEKPAWRVEEFLGMRRSSEIPKLPIVDDTAEADLVVLDDAGLGFRDHPDLWPLAIGTPSKKKPWLVVKMAKPVAQGPLWEHLHSQCSDNLIVITTANDLRLTEVQISRELSWERTAQDVFWELIHNPCVNALSHCAHVIVSFGTAGAILLSRQKEQKIASNCFLIFDPKFIEGMWEQNYPGGVIGYTSCLTAGIIHQWMISPKDPNIPLGIQTGLAALRALHLDGYGERGASIDQVRLQFPVKTIASILAQGKTNFAMVEVQDPLRFIKQPGDPDQRPLSAGFWTILQDRYKGMLDRVAGQIVLKGPEHALEGVPLGQFGNLLTVDRQEIEGFRSIRTLVSEYCQQGQQKRPLSIAVFGSPGSGKSFGIIEVANSLLPGQIEVREFNLSQLNSPIELLAALHQVRDVGLSGKIPLVFWDEFDTALNGEPLGWLRHFLAPMQDGRFQEGQITHPIGRSIFVFAGGTAASMTEFGQGLSPEAFRAAKGPDFTSRLKGYVNILGPNPAKSVESDPYFIIRRAILLRSILKRNVPQIFEKREGKEILAMDRGVLRALLQTREYRHGVRSIESIIAMSQLTGKSAFERSSLPSETQLDLHVNGQDFLALVQQIELEGEVLEALAAAAHEIFCQGLKELGYQLGPLTDETLKTHTALIPYADLSEDLKEQNRQNVRDISTKLASAGYVMIPARSNEPPFNFPGEDLERLSAMEHVRWMKSKVAQGWAFAQEMDQDQKLHNALLPWDELPENEKEKDRQLVRGIPQILSRAGYAIVKSKHISQQS